MRVADDPSDNLVNIMIPTQHQARIRLEPIASMLHTLGLVLIVAIFSALGRHLVGNQSASALEQFGRVRIYLLALSSEWILFLYVRLGLRIEVASVRAIVDEAALTFRRWCLYVGVAVAAAVVWMGCGYVLGIFLHIPPDAISHLLVLMPRNNLEKLIWVLLSVSAAFCEEFNYRGYLFRQIHYATGYRAAAVVVQAVVYGAAHAALPWQIVVSVTILGLLFGTVAAICKSLVPGMLLHAGMDILPGILFRA